jgi:hypothetical protein
MVKNFFKNVCDCARKKRKTYDYIPSPWKANLDAWRQKIHGWEPKIKQGILLLLAAFLMYSLIVASPMKINPKVLRVNLEEASKTYPKLKNEIISEAIKINARRRIAPDNTYLPDRQKQIDVVMNSPDTEKKINKIMNSRNRWERISENLGSEIMPDNSIIRYSLETLRSVCSPSRSDKPTVKTHELSYECQLFDRGMTIQLDKANTEIQSRLNQEVEWFKLKYLYVGVILLGFLINTYFKNSSDQESKHGDDHEPESTFGRFVAASQSSVTSFILSLSVVVAVSIDMQIRAGRIVINQLGSWIYNFAEPLLLRLNGNLPNKLGWEAFLRLDGGYHNNTVTAMTFWTNIYILSIALYILCLEVSRRALKKHKDEPSKHIVYFGFWMLHMTLLIATFSNHIVPFTFRVDPFPILTGWNASVDPVHPKWLAPIYFVVWSLLVVVALIYIRLDIKPQKAKSISAKQLTLELRTPRKIANQWRSTD